LIATPTEWDEVENGEAPKIRIHIPRRPQPGTAAGVGDRALAADREAGRQQRRRSNRGASSRWSITPKPACSESSAPCRWRRTARSGRQEAGSVRELNIAKADSNGAQDGDLVSVDLVRSRGFWTGLRQGD